MGQYHLSGGDSPINSLQFNIPEKRFYLAWISSVLNSLRRPADNRVQYENIFLVVGPKAKSAAQREFVLVLDDFFEPIEKRSWA